MSTQFEPTEQGVASVSETASETPSASDAAANPPKSVAKAVIIGILAFAAMLIAGMYK